MRATSITIAVLILLAVAYVLSYAPMYRLLPRFPVTAIDNDPSIPAYRPVEWLIDETLLREPLLCWSDVWGVRDSMELDSNWRKFDIRPFHEL